MLRYIKSFCLALMICSRSLTQLLDFPRSSIYIVLLGFMAIFITSLKQIYNSKKLILISFIGICFALSLWVSGMNKVTVEYLLYFICFGVTSLIIPVIKDFKLVIQFILLIGLLLVWSYTHIDYTEIVTNLGGMNDNVGAVLMDISYKTLVFVISGIMLLVIGDNYFIKIGAALIALIYLVISFIYGARGALLSVCVFLFVFWIIRSHNVCERNKRMWLSALILLFAIVFFSPIIEYTYTFLESHDIEARSIERIYYKIADNESMSVGRDLIYKRAIAGIAGSPILGSGIGSFDNYSGGYPHNVILQLLYEGGILLAIPLIFLLFKGFFLVFSFKYDPLYRNFLLLLFCSGVIELFLSSHLWMSLFFWLFIGQTLLCKKYIVKEVCQKNV